AKVVKEKLEQFTTNFSYLFLKNSKAPIKINIINIKNDKEVIRGIFEYIKKKNSYILSCPSLNNAISSLYLK
ncbi:MAG: hypothetical protein RR777_06400, partial [Christensenellaceae bacterium]